MKDNIEKYIVNSYILESLNKVNEEASISYEADVMIYEFVNHLSGVIYSLSLMGPEAKQALLQHEPFTLGWYFIPITNVKRKKPEEKNAEDYMFMKPQTEKEYVLQKHKNNFNLGYPVFYKFVYINDDSILGVEDRKKPYKPDDKIMICINLKNYDTQTSYADISGALNHETRHIIDMYITNKNLLHNDDRNNVDYEANRMKLFDITDKDRYFCNKVLYFMNPSEQDANKQGSYKAVEKYFEVKIDDKGNIQKDEYGNSLRYGNWFIKELHGLTVREQVVKMIYTPESQNHNQIGEFKACVSEIKEMTNIIDKKGVANPEPLKRLIFIAYYLTTYGFFKKNILKKKRRNYDMELVDITNRLFKEDKRIVDMLDNVSVWCKKPGFDKVLKLIIEEIEETYLDYQYELYKSFINIAYKYSFVIENAHP